MSVLNMLAGSLPPTATYASREWRWIPAAPGEFPDGRIGTLTLTLQRAARNGRAKPVAVESDRYAVADDSEPLTGVMGRALLLLNETDPTQEDVYRVVLGPETTCTCRAGKVGRYSCKHSDAALVIEAEGGFDRG